MTRMRDRVIALSGALLFLVSSVALTVVVIVQMVQESKAKDKVATTGTTIKTEAGKLKGTKLEGFTPVAEVTETQSTDLTPGTGKEITSVNDTVTADYTGALAADGTIFESSLDSGQPLTTPLSGLIPGWQEGMIGMKEGGKRRMIIPAEKAYGAQGSGENIPPNSNLVFDVTLKKVGE